jgi:hypothetical protein
VQGRGQRRAGTAEIWAARAWNVLNDGLSFSLLFPALCLLAAAPLGLGPDGPLALALVGALGLAGVLSRFPFALRGRALLWVALLVAAPLLEPWRAPGLLVGALGGYAFFTVLFWGTLYYRLRTGAPWSNFLRFWRLVLTASDPTSGNAGEQVPKLLMALSAGALLAEEPAPASAARIAAVALVAAGLGLVARRRHRRRVPVYPSGPTAAAPPGAPIARRVYVIVIDGLNRDRLRQARTPTLDRLAREGSEYLGVATAYPAKTVTCFSSMLTGAAPAEHGMRSNLVGRLGVRRPSVFEVLERHGRCGRLVGIAHLLDAFPERHVRSVTSVQPTGQIDSSLVAAAREVVAREDPELLVLQLLAVDQLGHVRGTRNPEYLRQLEQTDRRVSDLLAWLAERGCLDGATVILTADHGQGRGIGGHGHLDWGESPVPFVVWGAGAVAGGVSGEERSVLELAATVSRLLGVEAPSGARGRPLVPVEDAGVRRPPAGGRALVAVTGPSAEARLPARAAGMELDPVTLRGATDAALHAVARLALAGGHRACAVLGEGYEPEEMGRLLDPIASGRAEYVLGSRLLGARSGLSLWRARERVAGALVGTLAGGTVLWDARTGFRALGPRATAALAAAPERDPATQSLARAGFRALELPVSYAGERAAPPRATAGSRGQARRNERAPTHGGRRRPSAAAPPQRTAR